MSPQKGDSVASRLVQDVGLPGSTLLDLSIVAGCLPGIRNVHPSEDARAELAGHDDLDGVRHPGGVNRVADRFYGVHRPAIDTQQNRSVILKRARHGHLEDAGSWPGVVRAGRQPQYQAEAHQSLEVGHRSSPRGLVDTRTGMEERSTAARKSPRSYCPFRFPAASR